MFSTLNLDKLGREINCVHCIVHHLLSTGTDIILLPPVARHIITLLTLVPQSYDVIISPHSAHSRWLPIRASPLTVLERRVVVDTGPHQSANKAVRQSGLDAEV